VYVVGVTLVKRVEAAEQEATSVCGLKLLVSEALGYLLLGTLVKRVEAAEQEAEALVLCLLRNSP
jgi:hypothetical protein